MKAILTRRVMRTGIKYGNLFYFHVDLLPYVGTQVIVRKEKEILKIFDVHGRPICAAAAICFSHAALVIAQKNRKVNRHD